MDGRGFTVDEQDLPQGLRALGGDELEGALASDWPCRAPGPLGPRAVWEIGFNEVPGSGGVCAAAPVEAGAPPAPAPLHPEPVRKSDPFASVTLAQPTTGPKIGPVPAPQDASPCLKTNGLTHPWKPRTPAQIAEFVALWHNPDRTVDQIGKRYKVAGRTVQKWRVEFGLQRRDQAQDLGAQGVKVGEAASQIVADMAESARLSQTIIKAAAAQALTSNAGDKAGSIIDPEDIKTWNPMADPEVLALVEEIRREAKLITQHSDLSALQRKLVKTSILIATKMPVYTWESLNSIMDSLSRALLWTRKVEADLPQSKADPVLLRQEAGRQLMHELREVLDPAEQQALATLVMTGANRIMAKKGLASPSSL